MEHEYTADMRSWAFKVAQNHVWRTLPHYDLDELLLEAGLCFAKCHHAYPDAKGGHFGALFRSSFLNKLEDLAQYRETKKHKVKFSNLNLAKLNCADVNWTRIKESAPAPLQRIFETAEYQGTLRNPQGEGDLKRRKGESFNTFLCRLAGVSRKLNMKAIIKDFLLHGEIPSDFAV